MNRFKSVVKAWQDHAADVMDIKISKFGGITKAKEAIDFCTNMGLSMTISDSWGSKFLIFGPIQLQIRASVRARPLQTTWATTATPQ